ncbi:hypothetical protein RCF19_29805 [Rhodococcus qingshengii]
MAFRYTSTENGQTIDSEDRLDHLEGLARWQVSEIAEIPEPQPSADVEAEKAAAIEAWLTAEAEANAEAEAKAEAEAAAEALAELAAEPAAVATPKARTRK